MGRKSLFDDEPEFDAPKARKLIVEGVDKWDRERLLEYAKECVELEVKEMTASFLRDYWYDEFPDVSPPLLEVAPADVEDAGSANGYGVPRYEIDRRLAS